MTGRRSSGTSFPDPDYCQYAAGTFLPLLMQLEAELQGVVKDDDIEYVHRCRVATRRIRAAFPLFFECFPDKKLRRWEKQIRRLTRSLGEARDLDVQIEFIRSVIADRKAGKEFSHTFFSQGIEEQHHNRSVVSVTCTEPKPPLSLLSRISHWLALCRLPKYADERSSSSVKKHGRNSAQTSQS